MMMTIFCLFGGLLRLRVSEFVVWMLWDFLPPVWERATIFALFFSGVPQCRQRNFFGRIDGFEDFCVYF